MRTDNLRRVLFFLVAFAAAAQAADADIENDIDQPFALKAGEHRTVGAQRVDVTLRSLRADAGCLAPDDCSAMLFAGTLVLRRGTVAELHDVHALIAPGKPFRIGFDGHDVLVEEVRPSARGELAATVRVSETEQTPPPPTAEEIEAARDEDPPADAAATPAQATAPQTPAPAAPPIAAPAPPDAKPGAPGVDLALRLDAPKGKDAPPLWRGWAMLSNSGWSISFHAASPLARLEGRRVGDTIWSAAQSFGNDHVLNFPELAADSRLELRAVAADGRALGPLVIPFDAVAEIRRQDMDTLRSTTGGWGSIRDHWIYFGHLYGARCGLKEVRYSVDNESLDQRFPLPPCSLARHGSSPPDDSDVISWPWKPKFVAEQLVYFDGTVSPVVVVRSSGQ